MGTLALSVSIAHATGARFVRAEGFAYAAVADEGLLEEADAGPLLRHRKAIGAEDVAIWSDVRKKHSAHAITGDLVLADHDRVQARRHGEQMMRDTIADGDIERGLGLGLYDHGRYIAGFDRGVHQPGSSDAFDGQATFKPRRRAPSTASTAAPRLAVTTSRSAQSAAASARSGGARPANAEVFEDAAHGSACRRGGPQDAGRRDRRGNDRGVH